MRMLTNICLILFGFVIALLGVIYALESQHQTVGILIAFGGGAIIIEGFYRG